MFLTILDSIKNIMETVGVSVDKAMDTLKVPMAERVISVDYKDGESYVQSH